MTLTIPNNLTKSLPQCDEATLLDIFKKGLVQYQAEKGLEPYPPHDQTDNLLSSKTKEKRHATIEEQGFSAIAIPKSTSNPIPSTNFSKTVTETESTGLLKLLEQCPLGTRTSEEIDKQFQALRFEGMRNPIS